MCTKLLTSQPFGEHVSSHFLSVTVHELDIAACHLFMDETVFNISMLRVPMKLWILAHGDSRLIIYGQSFWGTSQFRCKPPEPYRLLSGA